MNVQLSSQAPADGPLLVDTTTRKIAYPKDGRQQFRYIHPTEFPTSALAAQLADKWVEVSREVPGSSSELATGVRVFLRHLGQQLHEAHNLTRFDLRDLRRRHLDAWERELKDQSQRHHTDTPYRYAVHFSLC